LVGILVGKSDGLLVGMILIVGGAVGIKDGILLGLDGCSVGSLEGPLGAKVDLALGEPVGKKVGLFEGATVGC
jgi:hypothetical protein